MKKISLKYSLVIAALAAMTFVSCGDDGVSDPMPDPTPSETPTDKPNPGDNAQYAEKYRPQIHFTPVKNWINDPNGMVYKDGTWHLFYQYNPYGNDWGNMSWGHATSTDLIHWKEQDVALVRDRLGDIFSGSAVIDKNNTAGYGENAMICLYTSSGERQQQSMAYSIDGKTFRTYEKNPIIANTDKADFRDPKVFWHEESHQWVMSLARGWTYAIDFYGSQDLKSWKQLGSFKTDNVRCNWGQWECPDLIKLGDKWVLIVSTNPGGPVSGSGTMYFIGDFDGKEFKADDRDYPLWMDYGMDNYAGVTWSNAPGGRSIFLGWMNNWSYCGNVPCSPWRSAMTLPRELSLKTVGGQQYVASPVVSEIDGIASAWSNISGDLPAAKAYHVQVTVDMSRNHTINLSNAEGQTYAIDVKGTAKLLIVRRNGNAGDTSFNNNFSVPGIQAPVRSAESELTLDIFIDQSSVEIITADGTTSVTNLVFPSSIYNMVSVDGEEKGRVRTLRSIWAK